MHDMPTLKTEQRAWTASLVDGIPLAMAGLFSRGSMASRHWSSVVRLQLTADWAKPCCRPSIPSAQFHSYLLIFFTRVCLCPAGTTAPFQCAFNAWPFRMTHEPREPIESALPYFSLQVHPMVEDITKTLSFLRCVNATIG